LRWNAIEIDEHIFFIGHGLGTGVRKATSYETGWKLWRGRRRDDEGERVKLHQHEDIGSTAAIGWFNVPGISHQYLIVVWVQPIEARDICIWKWAALIEEVGRQSGGHRPLQWSIGVDGEKMTGHASHYRVGPYL
jgi:hypothetical protein